MLKEDWNEIIVKLRQGLGKDWQGMALKAKGLKALNPSLLFSEICPIRTSWTNTLNIFP